VDTGKGKLLQFNGPSTGEAKRFVVVLIVALMMTAGIPLMPVEAAEASINLREPDGGEDLIAGSVFTVRWQVSSSGGYIAIYLSTNGGERWSVLDTILSRPDHSFGYYDWNIPPNLESDACKIRVIWKSSIGKPWTEYARDESSGNFAVEPGVTVQFTEMPTLVAFGRYYLTTFDLYDPYDMVDHLDFKWRVYEGGWGSWVDLPGHFNDYDKTRGWIWWSPDYYETAFAEMRVEAVARGSSTVLASDTSDQFDIVSSATFLIQPNGGVTLVAGSTYTLVHRRLHRERLRARLDGAQHHHGRSPDPGHLPVRRVVHLRHRHERRPQQDHRQRQRPLGDAGIPQPPRGWRGRHGLG
jgi:hypothetical protein